MSGRHYDETTSLLNSQEVDENDIISYVQQRRASIVSVGPENIPPTFALSPKKSRSSFDHTTHFHTAGAGNSLHAVASNISFLQNDVSEILSIHSNAIIKEPETDVKTEARVLFKYSFPLIITFLLQYSLTVASVFSVGRLGSTALAAVSLSSMTANISGYAIIQGVSTCLDTLCGQAYGRQDYQSVGLHFIRCCYFLFLLYIPIFFLWVFGAKPLLLVLLGKDKEELVTMAANYLSVVSLGVPGFILFENSKHFLQSQGIFHASTYVLLVCAPLNALMNYVLVWNETIGIGFLGAPLSVVITNWLMCSALFFYIYFVSGYQCIPRRSLFHRSYFTNWTKMINLSIPGVLMVEAEWLAFEIITFTASSFGTDVLAAQSIISTTCCLLYQIPFAISIAASTRLAWYIGAASKKAAIVATHATLYTAIILGSFSGIFLFIFRRFFASLYTDEPRVLHIASQVLIIGAIYQVNDFLACCTGGILRGQGRQKIGGILNLVSYYLIALPCAFFFAFYVELELIGLWIGMIIALFFVSMSQSYFIITSNWEQIINDCVNEGIMEDGNLNIEAHSLVPSMSSAQIA